MSSAEDASPAPAATQGVTQDDKDDGYMQVAGSEADTTIGESNGPPQGMLGIQLKTPSGNVSPDGSEGTSPTPVDQKTSLADVEDPNAVSIDSTPSQHEDDHATSEPAAPVSASASTPTSVAAPGSNWPLTHKQKSALAAALRGEISKSTQTTPSITADEISRTMVNLAKANKLTREEPEIDTALVLDPSKIVDHLVALMQKGFWRTVLDVTAAFLTSNGQGPSSGGAKLPVVHSPQTMHAWVYRILALWKLNQFGTIQTELASFNSFDNPDLRWEFYPKKYPGQKGSMVPFTLRVAQAEVLSCNGQHGDAVDRLCNLLHTCQVGRERLVLGLSEDASPLTAAVKETTAPQALEVWAKRIERIRFGIGNVLLQQKEYDLATQVFEEILVDKSGDEAKALNLGLGRIALLLGDTERASRYFEAGTPANSHQCAGLIALSKGDFDAATTAFQKAWEADNSDVSAGNNQSVCMLYQGELGLATEHATSVMKAQNGELHETLIFNLCTLYELQSNEANDRKKAFIPQIVAHATDEFDLKNIKLSGIG